MTEQENTPSQRFESDLLDAYHENYRGERTDIRVESGEGVVEEWSYKLGRPEGEGIPPDYEGKFWVEDKLVKSETVAGAWVHYRYGPGEPKKSRVGVMGACFHPYPWGRKA